MVADAIRSAKGVETPVTDTTNTIEGELRTISKNVAGDIQEAPRELLTIDVHHKLQVTDRAAANINARETGMETSGRGLFGAGLAEMAEVRQSIV